MDIMAALADPVRRTIMETLNARPLTAGEIARRFPISRPAVSRHLRVLRDAGLVSMSKSGRTRIYRLDSTPLAELDAWLAQYRNLWSTRFDALETEVYRTRREQERQEQLNSDERMSSTEHGDPLAHNDTKEQSA